MLFPWVFAVKAAGCCRPVQVGMVSLTMVPWWYTVFLSSGGAAPYMVRRAGAGLDAELPAGLAHLGDGHPQADAPGGDAGPGDELLDCEADGFGVGFRVGQGGVGRQGCPDPGALVGDDDVEGVAFAVRHEADVYVCAVWGHAVFGGVIDEFGEGLRYGRAHPNAGVRTALNRLRRRGDGSGCR